MVIYPQKWENQKIYEIYLSFPMLRINCGPELTYTA
jgi:hypothetical protein